MNGDQQQPNPGITKLAGYLKQNYPAYQDATIEDMAEFMYLQPAAFDKGLQTLHQDKFSGMDFGDLYK
jgi:hypothetical protein